MSVKPNFRLLCELDLYTWALPICIAWDFAENSDWFVLQILCLRFTFEYGDLRPKPEIWEG